MDRGERFQWRRVASNGAVAVWLFAVFFGLVAAAAVVVGVHDASLSQAGFGVTAGSVVLVAIGVTLATAFYQLARQVRSSLWEGEKRPECRLIVLVAFFLALLLGIYLLFAALGAAGAQQPLVLAVAALLLVVPLLGFRFFSTEAHVTLPKIGAALALGIVGTAIGVWEFWYQNQYVPSLAGRAVALTVALHRDGEQSGFDVIKATVGYEDVGGKSVSVLGSVYTLTGSRVVRCSQPATPAKLDGFFDYFLTDPQRIRYMGDVYEEQPATVLAAGKFVGDGKRLDSNVSAGRDLVFFVPRHRFQLLRLRAQLFAIPGSVKLSQRAVPTYTPFPGDDELYGFWHIDDDSWFHDLVYGRERWVVLRYEFVDPGTRRFTGAFRVTARFPDPTWGKGPPNRATVDRLFSGQSPPSDASEPFADTEVALEPVADPGPRDRGHLPRCAAG